MFFLPRASLFVLRFFVFLVYFLPFVSRLVVSNSASDYLERLISKMSNKYNSACSLTYVPFCS